MHATDRQILRIALPSVVSNITVPLLGLVDVAITGHLGSAAYIAAIAVGSMTFNVIYWIFAFLRMGTSGLTAQALGAQRPAEIVRLLVRALAVALVIAAVLILLQWPLRRLSLFIMQPDPRVATLATIYFNICIWGAPPVLALYALNGWLIGMQDTHTPMTVAIAQNVVNIAASLFFVLVVGMRVEGVATGTLVAQWAALALTLVLTRRKHFRSVHRPQASRGSTPSLADAVDRLPLRRFLSSQLRPLTDYGRFFAVNRDLFLRTLCIVAVMLFFTAAGSWQGDVTLAVNTLLMQLYLLVSYVMDGLANAGEALCGRHYGAGHTRALRHTVARLFRMGALVAAAFTLLYIPFARPFLALLSDEPAVIAAARPYLVWAFLVPFTGFAAFVWDGIFIGLTAGRRMMQATMVAALVFFTLYLLLCCPHAILQPLTSELLQPALHFLFPHAAEHHLPLSASAFHGLGNHGLWIAFLSFMFTRGAVQTYLYATHRIIITPPAQQ